MYSAVKIDHEAVVRLIEDRRKSKGLSIRTVCEHAMIHEDTYGNIVRGKSSFTSAAYLLGLAGALDIPLEELARVLLPDVADWRTVFPERVVEIIQPVPEVLPVAAPAEPALPVAVAVDLSPLAAHLDTSHLRMEEQVQHATRALIDEYKSEIADLRKSRRLLFWALIGCLALCIVLLAVLGL